MVVRTHEIESWALSVVDQVNAGQPNEDSRVELKAQWIEPNKAARRIAGHANWAHGESILWLIGVDEKKGVTGANLVDIASWYPQVESQFDGLAPDVTSVNIPVEGKTIVALLFDTDRAPFVVKVPNTHLLEVPWRGSTSIRSARRDELLRLLSPLQKQPTLEILSALLAVSVETRKNAPTLLWQLAMKIYIVPRDPTLLVFPYHTSRCTVSFPEEGVSFGGGEPSMDLVDNITGTLSATSSELLVEGPGMFVYRNVQNMPSGMPLSKRDAHIKLELPFTGGERPTIVKAVLPHFLAKTEQKWGFGQFKREVLGITTTDAYGETTTVKGL
jgi:hypothetical protein